jgi:hypothetical protein
MLSATVKRQIETTGFGKSGDVGGQPKQRYWTPDGRERLAMPDLHEYVRTIDGKTETGTRDANLDQGWLPSKPVNPLPYCPGCDKWHKTQVLVDECIKKKDLLHQKFQRIAEKELKIEEKGNERITKLESDMGEIRNLLKKLLEK